MSTVAIRDYSESLKSRGAPVKKDARTSMMVFRGAVGVEWPAGSPIIHAAVHSGDYIPPLQAPAPAPSI